LKFNSAFTRQKLFKKDIMKKIKFLSMAFIAMLTFNSCSSNDNAGDTGTDVDLDLIAERSDEDINAAALPQAILTYISTNYPDNTIHEAEIEDNGQYEIELNNGIELIFDPQGNFLGIDDDGDDDFGDEDIAPGDLPEKIRNFITTHFTGATIEEAERESNGNYEVELSNDIELIFDADGNFLGRTDDDDDDDREDIAVSELPQVIRDYIAVNYSDNSIIEAEREDDNTYEVTLNNGLELYFDADGKFLGAEDQNGDDDDDDDDDDNDDD
jgi:hypothetical protein